MKISFITSLKSVASDWLVRNQFSNLTNQTAEMYDWLHNKKNPEAAFFFDQTEGKDMSF